MSSGGPIDRIASASPLLHSGAAGGPAGPAADRAAHAAIYVDGTVMMPTLKKALVEPAGISRVGLQIVASALLDASGASRLVVADHYARRLLAFVPDDRTSELGVMQQMTRIARSLQRSRLQRAWALARVSLARQPWQLPSEFSETASRSIFLFHGMNIKSGFLAEVLRARRQHGLKVALFLHDLLPLTHPEYTGGRAHEFRTFVSGFLDGCDLVIASSRHTAEAFPRAMSPIAGRALPPVAVVPLAHEYRPWQAGSTRPTLPGLANQDFALCVGKIEDRKNQLGLLRAWQRYRSATRRQTAAHLVLAGPPGVGSDKVIEFLEQTGYVDGTVHLLSAPSDPELTWLYEHCRFTAYVSFAEGWGLPIGESLWAGKTCLASRATAMPEVGGDLAVYVDPRSVDAMAEHLRRMLDEESYVDRLNEQISRTQLRTWRDFRSDLVDTIRSHCAN